MVLGWSGPFSGPLQSLAETNQAAIEMAVDQVNEDDGVDIKLVVKDDALSAEKAVTQAKQFISEDKIDVMMGPAVNTPFLAAQPIYHNAGLVQLLVGTAATGITDEYPNTWRLFFDGDAEARLIVERLRDHYGSTKIAILAENTGSGLPGADSLEKAINETDGVSLATKQLFATDKPDLGGYVDEIVKSGADGIALWSVGGANTANVVKALAAAGVTTPVVGDIGAVFKATPELAGDALGQVTLDAATFNTELYAEGAEPDPKAVALRDEVKSRLNVDELPDAFHLALMYYNAVHVFKEALKRSDGKTDPDALRAALVEGDIMTPLGDVYTFSEDDRNGYAPENLSFASIAPGSYNDGFWVRAEGAPGE
ncbi:ABC transporter substrate-binding protein [Nocardioides gansuensis]|uniref:ABC transporter substrate-binding protein n=1 Tax=Nocardioides gansuensis TaxID=2138300 RepID=UPI0014041A04|nr:ABC transporter substrate-binding protein [Nocardioides gansuensis]